MRRLRLVFGVLAALTVLVSGVAAADVGPAPEQAPATLASEVLLSKGRVKVGVTWKNPYTGQTGTAMVLPQGDEFAYFTFSSEANPEVFVKVLGGNDPNYIQLFAAGLTTFEYTATFTGCNTKKTFTKPAYARITYEDAAAFPSTACQPADPLDDSHYVLLKKDQTSGRIAYVHVHRIRDGRRVFIGYPYGRGLAAVASGTEVRMTMSGLKDFVRSQPPPPPPNTPYSIAPLLGYNPSTGQAPGQCYNINILPPQNPSLATSFSSANTSSSFSGQTNISASVGASFGAFKASDTFSHGDSYNSSANSGAVFFNASAIYTINSSIDPANPLTVQGQAAKTNNQLSQLCGIETMASVPAGMLVSGQFSWSSDSSATSTTISNTMKTSYGLAKVSNAISNAKAQGSSNITLNFVTQMEGGGSAAVTQMASDIAALDPAIASCGNGTTSACTAFASGADAAALKAVSTFTNSVTSTMTDFSSFVPFPQGVAGVSTTPLSTLPAVPASDALAPYQAQLRTYLTLLNQIATLDNRVNLYINPAITNTIYNPSGLLDLTYYTNELHFTYSGDKHSLLNDLTTCIYDSTTATVQASCAPIIANTYTNAYQYYAKTGTNPNANWLAQQNTVGLQYVATYTYPLGIFSWSAYELPKDVFYVDQLPPYFSPQYIDSRVDITNRAALVSFADAAHAGNRLGDVSLLVLINGVDLSQIYQSSSYVPSLWPFYFVGIYNSIYNGSPLAEWYQSNLPYSFAWTTPPCAPTFTNPCGFNYVTQDEYQIRQSTAAIPNFFLPN